MAVLTAVCALAVGACGGSSETAGTVSNGGKHTAAATVTVSLPTNLPTGDSKFIAVADRICARLNRALARPSGEPKTAAPVSTTRHHLALERKTAQQLGRLTPPASLAATWRQMNAYRHTLVNELETLARDEKTGNTKAQHALALSKLSLHRKLIEVASRSGFRDCAEVGTALNIVRVRAPGLAG